MARQITNDGKSDSNGFSQVAVATVAPMPIRLDPPMEITHSEARARVNAPKDKLLPDDRAKQVNQNPVWAMYWLNAPIPEAVFSVNAHYLKLKRMAENYQREHQDAFFEQYAQALILSDNEREHAIPSTAQLRMLYRKYCKRVAHYAYHYEMATWMLVCSLANLYILSQVNGPGATRNVGTLCKVSKINSMANQYAMYPKLKGQEELILNLSKFAIGSTGKGAQVVAMPHFVTDIYGNRGQHSLNLSDEVPSWRSDEAHVKFDDETGDYGNASVLVNRINKIIALYGSDATDDSGHLNRISKQLDPKNKCTTIPSTPVLENGAALSMRSFAAEDVPFTSYFKLNQSGATVGYKSITYTKDPLGIQVETDNIVSRAWDTFRFWSEYISTYFPEMRQPGNMLRDIVISLLDLEPSMTPEKFQTKINFGNFVDAAEIRQHMVYKKNNATNTATIVKWAPIIDVTSESSWLSPNQIVENLERYPVDNDDALTILKQNDAWPHLTPSIFYDVDVESDDGSNPPYIVNTIGSASVINDKTEYPLAGALVGRNASYLDIVASTDYDAYSAKVDTLMADPELVKQFIVAAKGISLTERPNNIYVRRQPIIDCSDPYQCGFNIIIAHDSVTLNEFEEWYRNPQNYSPVSDDEGAEPEFTQELFNLPSVDSDYQQFCPTLKTDLGDHKYGIAHVANPDYLAVVRHAVVFVGDAIFTSSRTAAMSMLSSTFPEICFAENLREDDNGDGLVHVVRNSAAGIPDSLANKAPIAIKDTIPEAVAFSLAKAAALWDPAEDSDDFDNAFFAMKNALALWAGDEDQSPIFRQHMFAPDYGLVRPVSYDVPDTDVGHSMGFTDLALEDTPLVMATKGFSPKVSLDHMSGLDIRPPVLFKSDALSYEAAPGQMLLWFIDKIHFRGIAWDGQSYYCRENEVKIPAFSAMAKASYSEFNRGEVEFLGSEDARWLYDDDLCKQAELPSAPGFGSVDLKQAPLVNAPKVDFRKSASNHGGRAGRGMGYTGPRRAPQGLTTPDNLGSRNPSPSNDRNPSHTNPASHPDALGSKGRGNGRKNKYSGSSDDGKTPSVPGVMTETVPEEIAKQQRDS